MSYEELRTIQLGMAIAALKRISRKMSGFTHTEPATECNCPKCIAKDTLDQMMEVNEWKP